MKKAMVQNQIAGILKLQVLGSTIWKFDRLGKLYPSLSH